MGELDWIRSHVERCLQQVWGHEPEPDADGDVSFRYGSAEGWVMVLDGNPPTVHVFAHVVEGVKRTSKLLIELNDTQRAVGPALFWYDGTVIAHEVLSPHGLTSESLSMALSDVGDLADHHGPLLAAVHGGTTPHPATAGISEEVT